MEASDSNMDAATLKRSTWYSFALQAAFLLKPVLFRGTATIILLQIIAALASQLFGYMTLEIQQTGRENLSAIAVLAISELTFTLIWSTIWLIAVCEIADSVLNSRAANSIEKIKTNFNQVLVEQTRSMASVLWRTPLLIVPALIQYIRLSFVPLIVLLSTEYNAGREDALKKSAQMSRGRFWLLTFIVLGTLLIPWLCEELVQGSGGQWVWENPIGVMSGWVLTLPINCFNSLFLFSIFRGILHTEPTMGISTRQNL